MSENRFTSKMALKSSTELREIVQKDSEFVQDAKDAAQFELDKRREEGTLKTNEEEKEIQIQKRIEQNKPHGEDLYRDFVKNIDAETRFGKQPNAELNFETKIPHDTIFIIAVKAFEKLEWDVVHFDESQVEAKRPFVDTWTEKVTVSISKDQKLTVKSVSLGGAHMDLGQNSKRVHLFEHVFKELESNHSEESLKELKEEVEKESNWENYEVPDILPGPDNLVEPNINKLFLPVILGAIVLAGLFAAVTQVLYIIVGYEIGIGYCLALLIDSGIKSGNFTNRRKLMVISLFATFFILFLHHFIDYLIVTNRADINVSFVQYMQLRIQAGLQIRHFNTGSIGYVILLVAQPFIIYFTCWFRVSIHLVKHELARIPNQVLEFAYYCVFKEKSIDEIKYELHNKGWTNPDHQEQVIKAIEADQQIKEIRRME